MLYKLINKIIFWLSDRYAYTNIVVHNSQQ